MSEDKEKYSKTDNMGGPAAGWVFVEAGERPTLCLCGKIFLLAWLAFFNF